MRPERWERLTAIFHAALARNSDDREAFVAVSCGDDVELRREVAAMLAAHDAATRFGDSPGLGDIQTYADSAHGISLTPGEMFDGRYRIANLVGRGGMGEVYRADDLRVGHPVALKFLSYRSPGHAHRIERFVREVRLARQIAHPNVCRVYDIGECDGRLYLSMEYIQGEDLQCLLRRVGPLPHAKALDVAHQLCAGLAAAHECGVLHLDLKPANVMIDARGRAVITDFGVARAAEEPGTITIAGTPAYMAPEQLAGGPLSVQTDLYALGLIIREILAGSRGLSSDWGEGARDGAPLRTSPAHMSDPQVDAAIRNCLEREVKDRPRSALAVATALPRGEALAAALAAGRTPSPDLVAAARREALRPAVAALLAAALTGGVLLVGLLNRWGLPSAAPALSPPVLAARAEEVMQSLGYSRPPADAAYWFTRNDGYLEQVLDRHAPFSAEEGDSRRPVRFVYRASPAQLVPANIFGMVLYRDPPAEVAGMLDINLDTHGRLLRFCAVPLRRGSTVARPVATPDWDPLFRAAALYRDGLSAVAPIGSPPVPYNVLAEWRSLENASDLRVTAAAFDGSPVYFDIASTSGPGATNGSWDPETISRLTTDPTVLFASAGVVLLSAVLIARRHALRGQADTGGASRLASYFFIVNVAATVLLPDHVTHFGEEYFLLAKLLAWGVYWSAAAAVLYLAFEPFVRRRWPAMLIGWNRILRGRVLDPAVGRDVLVGSVAGTSVVCIMWLVHAEGSWLSIDTMAPLRPALESFRDARHFTVLVLFLHINTLAFGLAGLFALAGFDRLLRGKWLGWAAWLIVSLAVTWPGLASGSDWRLALQVGIAQGMIAGPLLWRLGPVALATMFFTRDMLTRTPAALEFSAWYSNRSLIALAIVLGVALYAARTSVGLTFLNRAGQRPGTTRLI